MTLSKDCKAWLEKDWTHEFMEPDIQHFTEEEAAEFMTADEWGDEKEPLAGFYARLSAPGYLDATDWVGPYETEDEAIEALFELYGDE